MVFKVSFFFCCSCGFLNFLTITPYFLMFPHISPTSFFPYFTMLCDFPLYFTKLLNFLLFHHTLQFPHTFQYSPYFTILFNFPLFSVLFNFPPNIIILLNFPLFPLSSNKGIINTKIWKYAFNSKLRQIYTVIKKVL